ncbi:hypothetical protein HID58_069922, partial [Brassica napus]
AKYQFFCRSPFTIDETTYLQEGVSEEQHRQAIRETILLAITVCFVYNLQDLVGGLPIVCSHHILELMFNEPQLLLVYRVALEIEMVYGIPNDDEENEDPAQFLNLTGEEHISMDEGVTIPPEDPANYDPNIEVIKTIEQLENAFIDQSTPLDVQPLNVWRYSTHEDAYWDGMMDNETGYEVYLSQSPHPTEGVLGLQLAPNKRVSAPQPATIIIIDDNDGSYTGSSDGVNDNDNVTSAPPPEDMEPFSTVVIGDISILTTLTSNILTNCDIIIHIGVSSAAVSKQNTSSTHEVVVATDPAIFTSRAELKQHMALYALRHKFRFKNSRSSTEGMFNMQLESLCNKNEERRQVRNSENDIGTYMFSGRSNSAEYEEQSTHSVIGEMIKARFAGKGPRPNEIIQVMLSDHNIRISCWKAWRSREVALQYAKGSFNTSYKLLPEYLHKLVYPAAKHCAFILHLQRNITTHFKNKHLSYLVGKAAKAFQLDIMEANFDQSGGLLVSRINNDEYEVKEKNGSSFYVNLDTKSCSCYSFQMLLIPCPHAIAAAIKENKTLAAGYAEDIVPIRSEVNTCGITIDGQNEPLQIFPPASRRPPGKPRKSRILSTGEIRMKSPRRRHLCSRCKGKGHNKATCKVVI